MKRKYNDNEILDDINNGMRIKDVRIKHGIKALKTIYDIQNRIGKEPNGRNTKEFYLQKMEQTHNGKYSYPKFQEEYTNSHSKITIICKNCGDVFTQSISHHIWSKSGCPNCKRVKPNTIEKILNRSIILYGKGRYSYPYINDENISSVSKITIKCNICGNEFKQKVSNHLNLKNGCNKCNKSKNEQLISQHLELNKIEFTPQKKFEGCFYKRPLPFDLYLPNFNLCIEYDGEQHFKKRRNEHTKVKLKLRQQRDEIKTKFCFNNKINLERISYQDNLQEKLIYIFKKYKMPNLINFNYNLLYKAKKEEKTCCICHKEKELIQFNKNRHSMDGYKSQCKMCQSEINKNYYRNKKLCV